MPANALKAQWVVTCGVLPSYAEDEYTKVWTLTSKDLDGTDDERSKRFTDAVLEATNYAAGLQDPRRANWVRLEWMWL